MSQSSAESLRPVIHEAFREVFMEHTESNSAPDLSDDSVLLDSGLDSLGFALLVIRLESDLGFDPFILSSEPYYPQTFGDFVRFYDANRP